MHYVYPHKLILATKNIISTTASVFPQNEKALIRWEETKK